MRPAEPPGATPLVATLGEVVLGDDSLDGLLGLGHAGLDGVLDLGRNEVDLRLQRLDWTPCAEP